MNEEKIRRLVKIVEESNIAGLEISRWGKTIKITKTAYNSNSYTQHPSAPVHQAGPGPSHADSSSRSHPAEKAEAQETTPVETANALEIRAPMVGTFYRTPAPDADPYVEVGQTIKKGQVLCIIEAMKLMNEIESEHDGKLLAVMVENGQPVEYNQPLFRIEAA